MCVLGLSQSSMLGSGLGLQNLLHMQLAQQQLLHIKDKHMSNVRHANVCVCVCVRVCVGFSVGCFCHSFLMKCNNIRKALLCTANGFCAEMIGVKNYSHNIETSVLFITRMVM